MGILREFKRHADDISDMELTKLRDLEFSDYASLPYLCSKGWCSPLERVGDKLTPCGGCAILARKRRYD